MKKCSHHHAHVGGVPELENRLKRSSRKLTGQRQGILELLRNESRPMTNKEIHEGLPKGGCDLATIYRSMHLLQEMGMVKRLDFGDGSARFELMPEEGDIGHHHHLICLDCSDIVELEGCLVQELEKRIASAKGFVSVTHNLEFFGICPSCQKVGRGKKKATAKTVAATND